MNFDILWIVEGSKIQCVLCDKKVYDLDWIDNESSDKWDVETTMKHIVYWINEHFKKEEHKLK